MELYKRDDSTEENSELVIRITDFKVWKPKEKPWWGWKTKDERDLILDKVSGNIKRGEFAAVIGPSGAGKTTFLVSLAGKCTLPSDGTITINGINVKDVQCVVEIVPQFDVFIDSLSVMEHLTFISVTVANRCLNQQSQHVVSFEEALEPEVAEHKLIVAPFFKLGVVAILSDLKSYPAADTEMKLGSSKMNSNRSTLNMLMSELKLKPHKDTPIFALSGGERRLLSLATSLLSNPEILICDEPTTGLDSYNASIVVGVLKKLSLCGKIVICSVHQPSYDLFKEFTSVMLMAEGKLLFHGSQADCEELFESINLRCPINYNPAEFYISAVSHGRYLGKIQKYYEDRLEYYQPSAGEALCRSVSRRIWIKQVQLLLWRLSLTLKKEIKNHLIQLFLSVTVSALVLGTCYIGISGTTQRGIQDIRGFLWLITSEVSFSLAYNALYVFQYEIALFKREVGMYSCSAYLVSRFLSFIPRCVLWPPTLVTLATFAVNLPNHIITTLEIMTALIFAAIGSMAYGLGMSALFTSTGIMGDVMPCVDLPLFLMSGAFLSISSLPVWLYPVKFISHFYYAMDAVSNIYWRQITSIDCPSNSTSLCIKDGPSVLVAYGYSTNFIIQDSLGLLYVTLLWMFVGYCGLKREERKGYAY